MSNPSLVPGSNPFDPKVIEDQVRDQLLADPWFSNISVISSDPGDIVTQINAGLQSITLGVFVSVTNLKASKPDMPGPYFDGIRGIAAVIENPTNNRQGNYVTARQSAMVGAALIHRFAPAGVNERLFVTDVDWAEPPKKGLDLWHVLFTGKAGVSYAMPKIAAVVPSSTAPGAQEISLSCATPGAAIFYTLDRSAPSPRNPNARLYLPGVIVDQQGDPIAAQGGGLIQAQTSVGPIAILAGQMLKTRAWLAGYEANKPDITAVQY